MENAQGEDKVEVSLEAVEIIGEISRGLALYLAAYALFSIPANFYGSLMLVRLLEGASLRELPGLLSAKAVAVILLADLVGIAASILLMSETGHRHESVRLPPEGYLASQMYALGFLGGFVGALLLASYEITGGSWRGLVGLSLLFGGVVVGIAATVFMSKFLVRLSSIVGNTIETRSVGIAFLFQLVPVLGVILLGLAVLGLYIEYERLLSEFYRAANAG